MRLLRYSSGDVELVSFDEANIPPYAILSHTWSEGEVVFDEMNKGKGRNKAGFKKIQSCGERAAHDRLSYFWVDSCCIDKGIPAELQHAISSMFRWYQRSARCYVYLADVTKEGDLRQSKWFTRGWTLQELLAPVSVEFFAADWTPMGDKRSLEQQINEATGIPKTALRGDSLSRFSIENRMQWIQHRQATYDEDLAYSLMGIFDVTISLRYGEGKVAAFQRLQYEIEKFFECCRDLRLIDPIDHKQDIEYRKGGLLEGAYQWVLVHPDYQVWRQDNLLLWIRGDPGKGKTMLLCGIIDELKKTIGKTDLLAYFFCIKVDDRINNATAVLRGLIYMLIRQRPSLVSHIRKRYDEAGKALLNDSNTWFALADIFTNMLQDPNLPSTYLIIDAVDECMDWPKLLDLAKSLSHAKWIISSRNWPDIENALEPVAQLCLELNEKSISAAVTAYIRFKVDELAKRKSYSRTTKDAVQTYLLRNAQSTFLWVALVCRELADIPGWKVQRKMTTFPPGLDAVYQQMIDQIRDSEDADLCLRILAIAVTSYRPVTLDELEVFVDRPKGMSEEYDLSHVIPLCGSFLTLRDRTIILVHQSAKDFLTEKAYHEINPSRWNVHHDIFTRSLSMMSKVLRRDIYQLGSPGYPIENVAPPVPDPLSSVRYACVYWISHLLNTSRKMCPPTPQVIWNKMVW